MRDCDEKRLRGLKETCRVDVSLMRESTCLSVRELSSPAAAPSRGALPPDQGSQPLRYILRIFTPPQPGPSDVYRHLGERQHLVVETWIAALRGQRIEKPSHDAR